MFLGWLLTLVGLGALAYRLGWTSGGARGGRGGPSPLEILKERYARGEIGREEYLRMREELDI